MPVRSRGSLLAGTAALAGLIAVGLGCHSSYSDHDAFSIPKTPPQNGSFLPPRSDPALPTAYPAQPVINSGPTPLSDAAARPELRQAAPTTQVTTNKREVIASTWSPVQRVSAEQTVSGPELQENAPVVQEANAPHSENGVPAAPARLPIGTPLKNSSNGPLLKNSSNGSLLNGNDAAPSTNVVLPRPRSLKSPSSVVVSGEAPPTQPFPNVPPTVPREFEKMPLPPYVVEPPDILLIQASNRVTLRLQAIDGQHIVAPDGTVNLGIYGKIRVAGLTLDQVADAVAARLLEMMPGLLRGVPELDKEGKEKPGTEGQYVKEWQRDFSSLEMVKKELRVDVLAYNSKFYYVITDGGGYGQQVYPIPITGNETVLDALAKINGLPAVASKKRVWVARATRAGEPPKILPVDWVAVTKCGQSATNYQLFPGDRVYVDSNNLIKADSFLAKLYSPILRTFGVTLLGSATVNTIKLGTTSGISPFGFIR